MGEVDGERAADGLLALQPSARRTALRTREKASKNQLFCCFFCYQVLKMNSACL